MPFTQLTENLSAALQDLRRLLAPAGTAGPLLAAAGLLLLLLRAVFDAAADTARAKNEYEALQKSGLQFFAKSKKRSAGKKRTSRAAAAKAPRRNSAEDQPPQSPEKETAEAIPQGRDPYETSPLRPAESRDAGRKPAESCGAGPCDTMPLQSRDA